MPSSSYHFATEWDLVGTAREVADVLADPLELPRWWPSVYLAVAELTPGGAGGVGRRVMALTKGFLPYTLSWGFQVVESRHPYGFTLEAAGDFVGRGVWTFEERGAFVHVTYDWQIEARRPLLRLLSPVARPVFAANHRWAMQRGLESLELELARRRAPTDLERALVPAPPKPTTTSPVPLLLAAAGVAGAVLGAAHLIVRATRPRRR
ncbi:MAG: SRPBCC family protein [Thermoanaerobaculia bacterium]